MVEKQRYIEEFKRLNLQKTGKEISDAEALAHFTKLVTLVSAIWKPIEISVFENTQCPLCPRKINYEDFQDTTSRYEFLISGLCLSCQTEIFK